MNIFSFDGEFHNACTELFYSDVSIDRWELPYTIEIFTINHTINHSLNFISYAKIYRKNVSIVSFFNGFVNLMSIYICVYINIYIYIYITLI